jgi:hypothetical protein
MEAVSPHEEIDLFVTCSVCFTEFYGVKRNPKSHQRIRSICLHPSAGKNELTQSLLIGAQFFIF